MLFAVTGGAGFIGSHIVRELLKENYDVIVIDNMKVGNPKNVPETAEIIKSDIIDKDEISRILKDVDGIFHQAALIVQDSFTQKQEYFDVNVQGTKNIFDIAQKTQTKVVFASSSSVYGNPEKMPVKEYSQRKPINPYGQTKLEDEYLAETYSKQGLQVIGLRYFNVYGLGQNPAYAGVISKFLERLNHDKPPIIYGTGNQIRDFVFVKDVAHANIAAMNSDTLEGFFNVGTGMQPQ